MQEIELLCLFNNITLKFPKDLLMKKEIEIEDNSITFPEYIKIPDLGLYVTFLSSGYIKQSNLRLVLQIVAVADYLSQEKICSDLVSTFIIPELSVSNCLNVLKYIQVLSLEIYAEIHKKCVNVMTNNFEKFMTSLKDLPIHTLECIFQEFQADHEHSEAILEAFKEKNSCESFVELAIAEETRLANQNFTPELEFN